MGENPNPLCVETGLAGFATGIDTQEQAGYWQAACKPDWVFTGRLIQYVNAIKQTEHA